jgi:hypothetical protein
VVTTLQRGRGGSAYPAGPGVSAPGRALPPDVLGSLMSDPQLPALLASQDAWGLLMRLATLMTEAGDHPDSYCIDTPLENVKAAIRSGGSGWGNDRFARALDLLESKGLIHRERARGGGVGRGAVHGRIWATWDPAHLVIPPHLPNPPGGRIVVDTPLGHSPVSGNEARGVSGLASSVSRTHGNRKLLPLGQAAQIHEESGSPQPPTFGNQEAHIHDDDSHHHPDNTHPERPMPATYRQLLAEVGWFGAPPPGDHLVNEIVLRHMRDSGAFGNPGATFRTWTSEGPAAVLGYAHRFRLPVPTREDEGPAEPMMPVGEWNRLRVENPQWAATVATETRRRLPAGVELTVTRMRATALFVPLPTSAEGVVSA